jgi:hypothetical protein
VAVDFKVSGSDLSGTAQLNGANFEIIKIGNDLYVKAPDEFWAALTPSGKLAQFAALKGKYAKADTTFAAFATISGAFTPDALLKPEGTTSKGGTKTIGGIPGSEWSIAWTSQAPHERLTVGRLTGPRNGSRSRGRRTLRTGYELVQVSTGTAVDDPVPMNPNVVLAPGATAPL